MGKDQRWPPQRSVTISGIGGHVHRKRTNYLIQNSVKEDGSMCGIAGYLDSSGRKAEKKYVEKMLTKILHRGPDHSDSRTHENVSIGCTRLSILDLSEKGNQPFITEDRNGILVYNGEVYNYREIRTELEKQGAGFASSCDTEVVLQALHIWGPEKAIAKFNGMFAFAYYDIRNETLWLGRDQIGIKPLYFTQSNGVTAFASEMKALFEHPAIACKPDMHAITTYLMETRLDQWTPFENICELQPGTLLKITKDSNEKIVFFDLIRDLDVERLLHAEETSFEGWLNQFEELFPKCVESHLASNAPLAAMCSGGVDSSLIAACIKPLKPDLVAYVADVKGLETSETDRARKACNHLGIELQTVPVNREKYMQIWPHAAYHHDEPMFFKQNILQFAISERVHRDGFKVLLCGEGADELFGGYSWQRKVFDMWRVRRRRARIVNNRIVNNRFVRLLTRRISHFKPLDLDQLAGDPFRYQSEDFSPGQLSIRYLSAIDGGRRAIRRRKMMEKLAPLGKIEDRAFLARSFEDIYLHLVTSLKANDKMSMANSVESRVPFLDKRLIDFALHLPVNTKYSNGISKRLLKTAASKQLPHELMHRKKLGFGVSDQLTANTLDFLDNGWLEQMLKWRSGEREIIKDHIRSKSFLAFHMVSTEIWARLYFGNDPAENITDKLMALEK